MKKIFLLVAACMVSLYCSGDSRDINFFFKDIKNQMKDSDSIEIRFFNGGSATIRKEDIPHIDRIKYEVTSGSERKFLRKKKVYITDIRYFRFPYQTPGNIIQATEQQIDDINRDIANIPGGTPGVVIKLNEAQNELRFEVGQSRMIMTIP